MKNNRNIIRTLTIVDTLFILLLIILKWENLCSQFLESMLINLITGCLVSIIIAYIEYKNKIEKEINYFIKEMHRYYSSITRIEDYIKYSDKMDEPLFQSIQDEVNNVTKRCDIKQSKITIFPLFPTKKFNETINRINILYDLTFGIELCIINISNHYADSILKQKKSYPEKNIKDIKKIIKLEKEIINEEMLNIKKYGIENYWKNFLERNR